MSKTFNAKERNFVNAVSKSLQTANAKLQPIIKDAPKIGKQIIEIKDRATKELVKQAKVMDPNNRVVYNAAKRAVEVINTGDFKGPRWTFIVLSVLFMLGSIGLTIVMILFGIGEIGVMPLDEDGITMFILAAIGIFVFALIAGGLFFVGFRGLDHFRKGKERQISPKP